VADKFTQLILDALTRAAADPTGVPLFGSKTEPGLFPPTAAARPAAKRCLDDGLLEVLRTDARGKQPREVCGATGKGLQFLLDRVSPKQVLEDFVRVLEARQGQVDELVDTARRMADGLAGLRAAVAAVLPQVAAARVDVRPTAPPPRTPEADGEDDRFTAPTRDGTGGGILHVNGTATRPAPPRADAGELAGAILTHLADWAASAGAAQDCPLPELYRALTTRTDPPTIGEFHDGLRRLHAARRVYLHPWTGPLYALPEPAYALLVGHEVAYYASTRAGD